MHSMKQRHCVLCCCINSVNAGKAARSYRRVHGKHLGLEGDSGYGGSSTAATSTHSPSHLIERYQKMSMHPLGEGELRLC